VEPADGRRAAGLWKASELRQALAEAGLTVSAGKMSHLWSGTPISLRLDDLDVICAVLECTPADLLTPDPVPAQATPAPAEAASAAESIRPVRRGRTRRTAPPV